MDAPPTPRSASQAPAVAPAVVARRPGTVTAAAILMIVTGVLFAVPTAILVLGVLASGNLGGQPGPYGPNPAAGIGEFLLLLAMIPLAVGVLEIVAGAKVLSGKAWARDTGIALAVILGFAGLLLLIDGLSGGNANLVDGALGVAVLAPNAFIIYALLTGRRWFTARSARPS